MSDRLLNIKQVSQKVSFGKSKIYEMLKKEEFPKPVRIDNNVRWKESEIDYWIDSLKKDYDETG